MSFASDSNISRFNKYKSLCENAASLCIRSFLHIVRPAEGFSYYSNFDIHRAWLEWKDAEEVFYRMTGSGSGWQAPPNRVFPAPPPEDAEYLPCRQMWGCLVQEQVERQDFQAPYLKDAVNAILASEACKSHPASCPCKVPNNPWTWHECVAELEPLGLKHNPKCQCGGWQRCKQLIPMPPAQPPAQPRGEAQAQAEAALAANPELKADLASCCCAAQYSPDPCYCLPDRVAEAKSWARARQSAKMQAAANAAAERASAEAAEWRANNEEKREAIDTCYCDARYTAMSCECLPDSETEAPLEPAAVALLEPAAVAPLEPAAPPTGFLPSALPSSAATLPTPVSRQSSYDYQHHVDTCPCGTCHKSRVDSGTAHQYMERCRRETDLGLKRATCPGCKATEKVSGRNICMECYVEKNAYDSRGFLKMPTELHMMRQAYVLEEASWIATKTERDERAPASQISANSSDFAKDIFAALGTPYDSKCPHGLPFYACMPCSH